MHRIEAELLIPGRGDPIGDGVVVLDGPSISYAGPAAAAPPTPGAQVTRVILEGSPGHMIATGVEYRTSTGPY